MSSLLSRVLEGTIVSRLAAEHRFLSPSPKMAAWIRGYGAAHGVAFPTTDESGDRARYKLTIGGQAFGVGRGTEAFDTCTPKGLPVQVKSTGGAADLGCSAAWRAIVAACRGGAPYFFLQARGETAPDAIPASGVGEVKPSRAVTVRIFDLGPTIREHAEVLTVREGRGDKGVLWLRRDRAYTRLRVQLKRVQPLTGWMTVDEAAAVLAEIPVKWSRRDRHAIGQKNGIRLFENGQVRVHGKHAATLDRVEAALLLALLTTDEPVASCRQQKAKLGRKLKGHATLVSVRGKGYLLG